MRVQSSHINSPKIKQKINKPEAKIPIKGTFAQDSRFKDANYHCKATGGTVFTGPASYDPILNFKRLNQQPCSAVMKRETIFHGDECKKQSYGHVGKNLRYQPGWIPIYSE